MRKNLIDAGPLVAYFLGGEKNHAWAVALFERHGWFHTCEAVMAEACARLEYEGDRPAKVLRLVEAGVLKVDFHTSPAASRIARLMEKYSDLPMDFADACLVVMAEDHRATTIYTLDESDFSVYRRNGREVVPFESPPT
jgi:predicted nucleic acid-binding protein